MLARNTILNLVGQALPLLVAVVSVPVAIRGLGVDAFGVLSLAWMTLGYVSVFDLGLGAATTKFVAEARGRGDDASVPAIVWTASVSQLAMGVAGGVLLTVLTPWLVGSVLRIPEALARDAQITFYLMAACSPVVLMTATFRGLLEAEQRFDLVNLVKVPASTLNYLWPAATLLLGLNLPQVVGLLVITRLGALLAYASLGRRWLRRGTSPIRPGAELFRQLVSYGGWVTVSTVISPVLVYLDRFLIGSLVGVAAVGYYTAPYEMAVRITIVSTSLVMTLFPVFSMASASPVTEALRLLYRRSLRYVYLVVGAVAVICVAFGDALMSLWLGESIARASGVVFQVLVVGVLANSLGRVSYSLLQGLGHPDLTAKLHLVELGVYIPVAWLLVSTFGLVGGAVAWTVRVTADALVLDVLSRRRLGAQGDHSSLATSLRPTSLCLLALLVGLLAVRWVVGHSVAAALVGAVLVACVTAVAGWHKALDDTDRIIAHRGLSRLRRALQP